MMKHRWRELTKSFGSAVGPEKAEELKRTNTDIENNHTRILELIKNEEQTKNDGNPKDSRKQAELVGLIEDFYKQYQSLYRLYDRLTGEYGRLVPRRIERGTSSLSSSSSDSEYFSSEEIDSINRRLTENENQNVSDTTKQELEIGNAEVINKTPRKHADKKERKRSAPANVNEVLDTQASAQLKELEERLNFQKEELESLRKLKRVLEVEVESKITEAKQLSAKNTVLHARILELELLLKEKETKLKNNENHAMSNIAELKARIKNLEQEAISLRTQKGEMEEKIISNKNEAFSQIKGLMEQLDDMQQNLDSLNNQNKELEAKLERNREETSQQLIQIEDLKEKLAEKTSVEEKMLEEKDHLIGRIKGLELEVESQCNQTEELEEQLRGKGYEIDQLTEENKSLHDRNVELKKAMKQRGEELSTLMMEHESGKNGASTPAMALTAEVNDLRLELDSLQEQKSKLEIENERGKKEYSESLAKMENLNSKLASKIADQERVIKEQAETVEQVNAEYKQAKSLTKNFRLNRQFIERRMVELAEEFRKKLEDNIRLLYRRIHVAELMHNENKDGFKLAKERYEQEIRKLEEKIASHEDEARKKGVMRVTPMEIQNGLDLGALDFAAVKIEEQTEHFLSRISKMVDEVECTKDWIKRRKGEMEQLKNNADCLTTLLDDREAQELLLREKVWKLEARVSKEGGEKLNLTKVVSQLENRVGKLEKNLKEKDEELISQGEKKREAIRQLCILVDYHRNRCDYLKDLITKTRVIDRTRA